MDDDNTENYLQTNNINKNLFTRTTTKKSYYSRMTAAMKKYLHTDEDNQKLFTQGRK